jgi:two-component system, response regulator YesN
MFETKKQGLSLFMIFFLISCGVILLLSLTLGGALYASYEEDLLRSVESGDRDNLVQIGNYLSELLDSTHLLAASLFLDPELSSFYIDRRMGEYEIANRLNDIKLKTLAYPYLHSVVIYDHLSDSLYTTLTRKKYGSSNFPDQAFLKDLAAGKDIAGLLPRSLSVQNNFTTIKENLLTVVVYRNPGLRDSFIALNMNAREIGSRLSLISKDTSVPLNRIFLMDSQGIVIAHSSPCEFGRDLSSSAAFKPILAEERRAGSYVAIDEGRRTIVTWLKKDGLNLVRATSYAQATSSLAGLRNRTILACLAALVLYLGLSFLAQKLAFRPLASLTGKIERILDAGKRQGGDHNEVDILDAAFTVALEHVEELTAFKERSLDLLRERFLADLASGRLAERSLIEERLASYGLEAWAERGFRLVGLSLAEAEAVPGVLAFPLSRDLVAVMIEAGNEGAEEAAAARAEALAESVLASSGRRPETSLGSAFPSILLLAEAAEELRRIASYWFFTEEGLVLGDGMLREREEASYLYPAAIEEKMHEALRRRRMADARACQEEFLRAIAGFSYENAMLGLNRWTAGLFDLITSLESTGMLQFNLQFSKCIAEVQAARKLRDLGPVFSALLGRMEEAFERSRVSRGGEVAERLKALIDGGFADANISIKFLSAKVKLTPAYTGLVFKQAYDVSIPQYLLNLRLERARELIQAESGLIKEIARMVGIENSRYFYTQYKKKFGVSPGRYMRGKKAP